MEPKSYDNPTLSEARARIERLFAAYRELTGFPESFVSKIACNDPKFSRSYQERDFRHGTVDTAIARLSAVWPEGADWPEGVPRLEPIEIEADLLAEIRGRLDKRHPLPGGAKWPADIPRPELSSTETASKGAA